MGKKKKQEDPGSWHCSLVLEEGFSSLGLLVTKSSEQWRSIRIAERSCNGGKKKGTSTPSLSGPMHFPLMGQFGMATAMSSLLDSLAPHSLQLGREREREMSTISGQRPGELLAKYFSTNQEQSGWRMSPDCFGCMEQLFSETLPKWGSIVDGGLYPLEMPVRDISGSDGGVWLKNKDDQVWPTPTCGDSKSTGSFGYEKTSTHSPGMTLCDATERGFRYPTPQSREGIRKRGEKKWPTPQSRDWKNAHGPRFNDPERSNDLNDAVDHRERQKWPTPTVSHAVRGNHDEPIEKFQQRVLDYETGKTKGKPGQSLGIAVRIESGELWSTPTTQDGQNNGGPAQSEINSLPLNAQVGGRLNPAWVEWLMCFPIGWTSLEPMPAERMAEWEKGVLDGSWWAIDPAEDSWTDCDCCGESYCEAHDAHASECCCPPEPVPRLTSIKESRVNRLKALGNGQVPAQALLAWETLSNE
jgi:hypothetical protein